MALYGGWRLNRNHPHARGLVGWWGAFPGTTWANALPDLGGTFPSIAQGNGFALGAPMRPGGWGTTPLFVASSSLHYVVTHTGPLDGAFATAGSMTCWVYIGALPGAWTGIVTKGRNTNPWWGLWITDTNLWTYGKIGTNLDGPTPVVGWTHMAITFNSTSGRAIYVNGVSANTNAETASESTSSDLWIGGSESVTEYLNGSVDDVRVYDRTIAADEIYAIYATSRAGNQGLLVPGKRRVLVA